MISVKFAESLRSSPVVATFHFLPTRGLRRNLASHDPSASEFGQIMMCNEHWRARVFLRFLCSLAIVQNRPLKKWTEHSNLEICTLGIFKNPVILHQLNQPL